MKTIEVDEELYRYIASHTLHIGESASEILRRMLNLSPTVAASKQEAEVVIPVAVTTQADRIHDVQALLDSGELISQKKAVDRFLLILSTLYRVDRASFADATELLHGRTRVYFSHSQQTLLKNGKHTKPKSIPDTPYWVITNTNTERKRSMVEQIMLSMQFSAELTAAICLTI
ncbi:replication initiation negative regulator SeqA [Budviciaceae bacterium CWB-B4]|uniref:Negative modulator of initiation of replication n=1 Tax=Limnobaculum xujianqingii TaxID=2738837 RepID=A0A9D7FWX4_9GAMM|nr:replication initiation negative regulator SeqA [Limnobaculum xujianqingii]MBK5072437.1 replication initiation negative regulator SeqA [Limnobaculum xujianqingii]MBK5175746.1 replication initiation negative regulator SeqA [Limnobaculum xujianqingii]